jgi:toxin ParE1/3/4
LPLRLRYSVLAGSDLLSIYQYIANTSPVAAERFLSQIEARCRLLCEAPGLGVARDDILRGIRVFSMRRRVAIAYRVDGEDLRVERVFYGGRDFESILARL